MNDIERIIRNNIRIDKKKYEFEVDNDEYEEIVWNLENKSRIFNNEYLKQLRGEIL